MEEFKRVFGIKFIMVFTVTVLLNIGLFVYSSSEGKSMSDIRQETHYRQWIIGELSDMQPEEALEIADIQSDSVIKRKYDELESEEQTVYSRQLNKIKEQLEYIIKYPENIKNIQNNADTLKSFSIFADKNSFTYNNIQKTAKDFKRVEGVQLYLTDNKAVSGFVTYYYIYYLALILNVFVLYELFGERENGMWCIVHTSKSGRAKLAFNRTMIITASAFIITGVLFFTTFLTSFILYKTASINAPIQNIESFSRFSLPMSQLQYIIYDFLYSFCAVLTLTAIVWMAFVFIRHRNIAVTVIAVFMGVEMLLYQKIQSQSVYGIFKQINLIRLLKVNDIISTYANRGKGTFVVSESNIMLTVTTVLFIAACTGGILGTVYMRPEQKKSVIARIADKIWEMYQHLLSGFSITAKEFHKLLITGRGLIVIGVLAILAVYFVRYGQMTFSDSTKELDNTYITNGGKEYHYITDMVNERLNDYQSAVKDAQDCMVRYNAGEATLEEVTESSSTVSLYAVKLGRVSEFMKKQEYLQEINEKYGVDGYMISDRGYEEIFGKYSIIRETVLFLALAAAIILIVAENIVLEYRTGMNYIINASRHGRCWIQIHRALTGAVLTIILFCFIYGMDMYTMYTMYGMPYLEAPLMSLTFMEGCNPSFTIGQWIIIRLVKRFVVILQIYIATYVITNVVMVVRKEKTY